MLSATHSDALAFNTRSRAAQQHSSNDSTPQTDAAAPAINEWETLHQNLCQQIDWKHYFQCKRQTPFANIFQDACQMEKHQNMPWTHTRNSWLS